MGPKKGVEASVACVTNGFKVQLFVINTLHISLEFLLTLCLSSEILRAMETKAFAYLRVSGPGQVHGDGFTRQLTAIKKYAAANNIKIVRIFREEGVCGATDWEDRPAFSEMMGILLSNGVKTVLIERLDRLARDLMVQESVIADFQRKDLTLVSVSEPDLLVEDPSRILMRQNAGCILSVREDSARG